MNVKCKPIYVCHYSDQAECCMFEECPLFKKCFPEGIEGLAKVVVTWKGGGYE